MKKSIIISALAALALNASAADVKPYGFRYADLRTAEPLHPVLVTDEGEFLNAEGTYVNFVSIGDKDANSWVEYNIIEKRKTITKELKVPAAELKVFGEAFYMDFTPTILGTIDVARLGKVAGTAEYKGATISYTDTYYKSILRDHPKGGINYMPATFEVISKDGQIQGTYYMYTSAQLSDGSYAASEVAEIRREAPNAMDIDLPVRVKYIQQDQYEFQVLALEAAHLVNSTNYVGGAHDRLVAAITTQGVKWQQQCVELKDAYDTFLAQVLALNVDIDNHMFGDKVNLGYENDGERYLTIEGAPFDKFTVSFESYDKDGNATIDRVFWHVAEDQPTQLDAEGKATVKIIFEPYNSVQLEKHNTVYNAIAVVTIEKANSNFKNEEASMGYGSYLELKKALNGVDPAMSFVLPDESNIAEDGASLLIEKNIDLAITSCEKSESVIFYTAGYDIEGTVTEGILAGDALDETTMPTASIWGDDADKFNVEIRRIPSRRPGLNAYEAIVSLKSAETDNYSAEIEIGDRYNPENHITIWATAGNVDINLINSDQEKIGSDDVIDFPYNGGQAVIAVAYNNFEGVNAGKQIQVASTNPDIFNPEFFYYVNGEKQYKGAVSEPLNGVGTIYLSVQCAPSEENTGVEEAEIKVWINNVEKTFKVRRTDPTIWDKAAAEHARGLFFNDSKYVDGYVYEEVEFYVVNCINYYNVLNDLVVETDLPHIFEVCPVSYIHNGHLDNEANGYHANLGVNDPSQFQVKVRIKYIPTHNVAYDGTLSVYLKNCPDERFDIALHGQPLSSAVFAAIHGTATGLNKVEAENENAPIYNVGGQRVNNAKGLVIINGNKIVK